jgi:hypothetical protein
MLQAGCRISGAPSCFPGRFAGSGGAMDAREQLVNQAGDLAADNEQTFFG